MTSYNALPPTVVHPSTLRRISTSEAQAKVAKYLKLSRRRPHLHPDARLEQTGPTFSVTGGSRGGIILHQLRRLEAGLRGEVLAPDTAAATLTLNGEVLAGGDGAGKGGASGTTGNAKLDAMIAAAEAEMDAEDEAAAGTTAGSPAKKGKKRKAEDAEMVDAEDRVEVRNGTVQASADHGEWQDPEIMNLQDDNWDAGGFEDHDNTLVAEGGKVPALKTGEEAGDGEVTSPQKKKKKKKRRKEDEEAMLAELPDEGGLNGSEAGSDDGTRDEDVDEASVKDAAKARRKAEKRARKEEKRARKAEKHARKQAKAHASQSQRSDTSKTGVAEAGADVTPSTGGKKREKKRHKHE